MSAGNLLEALTDNLVVDKTKCIFVESVRRRAYSTIFGSIAPLVLRPVLGPEHSGICAVGGSGEG